MKPPTLRFVFDRKHMSSLTKKGLVQIEVSFQGKRKWIGTNVKLYSNQWDDRKKVIRSNDSLRLNAMLDALMNKILDFITQRIKDGQGFAFPELEAFLKKPDGKESFLDFFRERIEVKGGISDSTRQKYHAVANSLLEFGRISSFKDLTKANLVLYDDFLHGKGMMQGSVHSYHSALKTFVNEAVRFGMVKENPYNGMHLELGKSKPRKYLTEAEVSRLKSCPNMSASMRRVRDLFLFQCYTGMSYADMAKFDFMNDVEERDGRYVISDRRQKTNEDYKVVLLSPAVAILKEYGWRLPIPSRSAYNRLLKKLAGYAGIDKNLTTHMGRHTFAVYALNHGVPIEVVSKMLGHTNIQTTQIYAKVLNKEVERGFDTLEKSLK